MAKTKLADILDSRAAERSTVIPDEKSEADIAYDFMFGLTDKPRDTTSSGDVRQPVPVVALVPYAKHPFKPYPEEMLRALAQSIQEHGLQQPIIVREAAGKRFEILAGHNRAAAFSLNGDAHIPAIIVGADDDQAAMIVTETNLRQREKLLPSEKAFAYKLQLEAIKHQGKRTDASEQNAVDEHGSATCVQIEHKLTSRDHVAENNGVNANDVYRHIRLTYLVPELLQLVDIGKLAFIAGVELSHLTEQQQNTVYQSCITEHAAHLDLKLAKYIREWVSDKKALNTPEDMDKLLKRNQKHVSEQRRSITFKRKTFEPYLSRLPSTADLERLFMEFLQERFGGGVPDNK